MFFMSSEIQIFRLYSVIGGAESQLKNSKTQELKIFKNHITATVSGALPIIIYIEDPRPTRRQLLTTVVPSIFLYGALVGNKSLHIVVCSEILYLILTDLLTGDMGRSLSNFQYGMLFLHNTIKAFKNSQHSRSGQYLTEVFQYIQRMPQETNVDKLLM